MCNIFLCLIDVVIQIIQNIHLHYNLTYSYDLFYNYFYYKQLLHKLMDQIQQNNQNKKSANNQKFNTFIINKANQQMLAGKFCEAINLYEIELNKSQLPQLKSDYIYIRNPRLYYEQLKKSQSLQINPIFALSICYAMSNNYDKGFNFFETMSRNEQQNTGGLLGTGSLFSIKGDNNKAIKFYTKIYEKQKRNQQALQQLSILFFSQNDDERAKFYLNQLQQRSKTQIKALYSFYYASKQESNKCEYLFLSNIDSPIRYFQFRTKLIQNQQNEDQLIKILKKNSIINQKNVLLQQIILVSLLKIYRKKRDATKSLQFAKQLYKNDKQNWLWYVNLGFEYINVNNFQEGISFMKQSKQMLKNRCLLSLTNENKKYILQLIEELLKLLHKNMFTTKNQSKSQIDHIYTIFSSLSDLRDDNLNSRINKIKFKTTNIFKFISNAVHTNYSFEDIFNNSYQLYKRNQNYFGLLLMFFSKYIYKSISTQNLSLIHVQNQLEKCLTQFKFNFQSKQNDLAQNHLQKEQYKAYTIKYTQTVIDAFKFDCYFRNHKHLSVKLQSYISKSVKPKLQILNSLIDELKNQKDLNIFDINVIQKASNIDKYIEINSIIESILPQMKHQKVYLLKQVDQQLKLFSTITMNNLLTLFLKQWQKLVTKILDERRQKKKPIKCLIQDWITIELTFPNHSNLIKCLQFILQWKDKNKYQIINVKEDNKFLKEETLSLVLNLGKISCIIKMMIHGQHLVKKKYQLEVKKLINNWPSIAFANLINLNRKKNSSIFQQIFEAQQYFKDSINPEQIKCSNHINQFIVGIQFFEYIQKNSIFQKRCYSSISQSILSEQENFEDEEYSISQRKLKKLQNYSMEQNDKLKIKKSGINLQNLLRTSKNEQQPQQQTAQNELKSSLNQQTNLSLDMSNETQIFEKQQINDKQQQEQRQQINKRYIEQINKLKQSLLKKEQNNSQLIKKIINLQNKVKDYDQAHQKNQKENQINQNYQQITKNLQEKEHQLSQIQQSHALEVELMKSRHEQNIFEIESKVKAEAQRLKSDYEIKSIQLTQRVKKIEQQYFNKLKTQNVELHKLIYQHSKQNEINSAIINRLKQNFKVSDIQEIHKKYRQLQKELKVKTSQIIRLQSQKEQLSKNRFGKKKNQKTARNNVYDQDEVSKQERQQKQTMVKRLEQVILAKNAIQRQNSKIKFQFQNFNSLINILNKEMAHLQSINQSQKMNSENSTKKYVQKIKELQAQLQKSEESKKQLNKNMQVQKQKYKKAKQNEMMMTTKNEWIKIFFCILFFMAVGFHSLTNLIK